MYANTKTTVLGMSQATLSPDIILTSHYESYRVTYPSIESYHSHRVTQAQTGYNESGHTTHPSAGFSFGAGDEPPHCERREPVKAQPHNTPTSDPLCKEILNMKESIATLSKAVHSLQPKATKTTQTHPNPAITTSSNPKTKGMVKGKRNPPTYAGYATQAALPPRPSLVLELGQAQIGSRPSPATICDTINKGLEGSLTHSQVHVSAVRWTVRGNLVITASADTSQYQLNSALMHVATYAKRSLNITQSIPTPIRANTRWSRILLNRVLTSATSENEAHSPTQCHTALRDENPSYASLTITQ
jgi:hypothetical protein